MDDEISPKTSCMENDYDNAQFTTSKTIEAVEIKNHVEILKRRFADWKKGKFLELYNESLTIQKRLKTSPSVN